MSDPFFSIVIPTRERAHLLRFALQSALAQRFDDYEVVVSDNFSSADTRRVVDEIRDSRVCYVRTPKVLSMPENWEFALSHAKGRYITFLCDDDALVPELLPTLARVIADTRTEVMTWSCGGYYHSNWPEVDKQNTAIISACTGQIKRFESSDALKKLYHDIWPLFAAPKMLQSCCSRQVIERVKSEVGQFFVTSCPDVSAAAFTLAATEFYIHIDRILMLSGCALESTGASQYRNRKQGAQEFKRQFQEDPLAYVPLKNIFGINFVADTLLRAKAKYSRLDSVELDWEIYFMYCMEWINIYRSFGENVDQDEEELRRAISNRPAAFLKNVEAILHSRRGPFYSRFKQWLQRKVPNLKALERALRLRLRLVSDVTLHGSESGFTNIAECAARLPERDACPESWRARFRKLKKGLK